MTQSPLILPAFGRPLPVQLQRLFEIARDTWHWIEQKRVQQLTSRRLRLSETVSLGEKRFISIITVDGVDMLIGASAANISLLAIFEPDEDSAPIRLSRSEHSS